MRVVIAAGGTGGHIFPAVALGRELAQRRRDVEIFFIGGPGGREADAAAREQWAFQALRVGGLKGAGRGRQLQVLLGLPGVLVAARRLLARFQPEVVVGAGGAVTGPVILAALTLGRPRLIHEQNSYPGLTNRLLGRWVDVVAVGFPEAGRFFPGRRVEVTGNPIRREILRGDRERARAAFGLAAGRLTVLLFGGSQGARRINEAAMAAAPLLRGHRDRLQFLHATGPADLPRVEAAYREAGHRADVRSFYDDMGSAYAAADVALCRAGALTIAELAAVGKPALLVPYPHAANDHQRLNAEAVVRVGGARMLSDDRCTGQGLAGFVSEALQEPGLLSGMAERIKGLARPDAAGRLADLALGLSRSHPGSLGGGGCSSGSSGFTS